MEVEDRLARVGSDVRDDPVPAQAGAGGHRPECAEEGAQEFAVLVRIGQVIGRPDVPPRDGEEVGRRPGIDVPEDDRSLVLVDPI